MMATVAAAVVLSVVTTSLVVGSRVDEQLAQQAQTIDALEHVTTMTLDVSAEPDAEHVELAGVSDPTLDGSIVFSPATTELVVVASGLDRAGRRLRVSLLGRGRRRSASASAGCSSATTWPTGRGAVPAIAGATSADDLRRLAGRRSQRTTIDTHPVLVSGD